jgi:quercetin dioxygenase-like cupin family protein
MTSSLWHAIVATVLAFSCTATAQVSETVPSGAADLPNPEHIRLLALKDVQWVGDERVKRATLFGDPSKPGVYGILYKWEPGHYSDPHFHNSDRFAFVISGSWWNSSKDTKDLSSTYPVPAGTFVQHVAGKTHWDGAKDEPAILLMVGMGPVDTVRVLPRRELPTPASGSQ